jgi:hypothetical protein
MIQDEMNMRDWETTVLQVAELAGLDTSDDNLTTTDVVEAVRDIVGKIDGFKKKLAAAEKQAFKDGYNDAIDDACGECEDNECMREALKELIQ